MKTVPQPVAHKAPRGFPQPWSGTFETPRLTVHPVVDTEDLRHAFDLVAIPSLAKGMEFPAGISWNAFEATFHRPPRKDLFLLWDRHSSRWAGMVVLWPFKDKAGWHQLLYGIHPDFQGRGLALEACRAILGLLARNKRSEGVAAIVEASNRGSLKVVRGLGMALRAGPPRTRWELPLPQFHPNLVERLWSLPRWEVVPGPLLWLAGVVHGLLLVSPWVDGM